MKLLTLTAFVLFCLSSFAEGEIGEKHQALCESDGAKEIMGPNGTCKVLVISQEPKNKSGVCIGQFKSLTCTINFAMIEAGSALNMDCGGFKQDMVAEGTAYKVAAIVTEENGEQTLIGDHRDYINLKNQMLSLNLVEEDGSIKDQSIELSFGLGPVLMTNVICY
ncbi:MAG TPA: hypothetical protein VNJ08_11145 [Bacteriovoracaceae bacterium]|nr:hypothetical protein [Bacteriovoracaceae bacterium]